ncbi:hypothetical protein V8C26DRAFT_440687 [Trichoderma gracile]
MAQPPVERLKEDRAMFLTAVQALKDAIDNLNTPVTDFWSKHGEYAGKISDRLVGNLLHVVVDLIKLRPHLLGRARPVIIDELVKGFPAVLTGLNIDGYNPLHLAIRDQSYELFRLIDSICNESGSVVHEHYFGEALAQTCSVANRTALHTYFERTRALDLQTAGVLIQHATDEQLAAQDAYGNTPMHYVVSLHHCHLEGLKIVEMLLDRDNQVIKKGCGSGQTSFFEVRNGNGYSVYQTLAESVDGERLRHRTSMQSENPLQETAFQEMSLLLKKHYMRTRGHREATSFLYGENVDDIEISFHYDNLPTDINWRDFTDRFGRDSTSGIKLDSVLQSVILPRIRVTHGGNADAEHSRDDMAHMLRWLHAKGVRHIISLSVEDRGGPSKNLHTQDAVQRCLSHFSVESLDWQWEDIDLEVIDNATLQWPTRTSHTRQNPLRELWLRWSGKRAVLRLWSSKEGLPKFLRLERVYLFKPDVHGTYDEEYIEQAIAQFRKELANNSPGIEVIVKESITRSDTGRESRTPFTRRRRVIPLDSSLELQEHLENAFRFSSCLKDEWTALQETSTSTAREDVVVAVIGDGVDIMDEELRNQCLMGKSFDYRESEDGQLRQVLRPPFVSGSDGTVIANLILQVCPMAKIYPIRLPENGCSLDPDPGYMVKAIEAALAKKATIMSLPKSMMYSLKLDSPGRRNFSSTVLRALERVRKEKVLMFCPSVNMDIFSAYPKGIIFIDSMCHYADKKLQESGQYFLFPGLDMPLYHRALGMSDYVSSNSVSTALATGLAAVIIYLVKMGVLSNQFRADEEEGMMVDFHFRENAAEEIARPEAMARLFRGLSPDARPPDLGAVWDSLNKKMRELNHGVVRSRRRKLLAMAYMILLSYR